MGSRFHWALIAYVTLGTRKIREQRIAATISVFIVISGLKPMRENYCRSKLATGKAQ
jgi:hypothetical protein